MGVTRAVSVDEEVENGMEDKRAENEGESLPSNNSFLSAFTMFLAAHRASNFSVRNFSYGTSFVLTFNIYRLSFQNQAEGKGVRNAPSCASTVLPSSTPQSHNDQGPGR